MPSLMLKLAPGLRERYCRKRSDSFFSTFFVVSEIMLNFALSSKKYGREQDYNISD